MQVTDLLNLEFQVADLKHLWGIELEIQFNVNK